MFGASHHGSHPTRSSDYVTCRHCLKDFKAITCRTLRKIHGYDGDHPILDYKRRFRLQYAMCPESRQKIGHAKDIFWARQGGTGSRERADRRNSADSPDGQDFELQGRPRPALPGGEASLRFVGAGLRRPAWTTRTRRASALGFRRRSSRRSGSWPPAKSPSMRAMSRQHFPTLFNVAVKRFPRSGQGPPGGGLRSRRAQEAPRPVDQGEGPGLGPPACCEEGLDPGVTHPPTSWALSRNASGKLDRLRRIAGDSLSRHQEAAAIGRRPRYARRSGDGRRKGTVGVQEGPTRLSSAAPSGEEVFRLVGWCSC